VRIAVPDGFHTDKAYIDHVRPGGTGPAADDHKQLFNYRSLCTIFEEVGYSSTLIEYWDENGVFRSDYKNGDEKGHIKRCLLNHRKNIDGKPNYTSLIIDFTK
jgi:predicted SAM-dependent methyltransferase